MQTTLSLFKLQLRISVIRIFQLHVFHWTISMAFFLAHPHTYTSQSEKDFLVFYVQLTVHVTLLFSVPFQFCNCFWMLLSSFVLNFIDVSMSRCTNTQTCLGEGFFFALCGTHFRLHRVCVLSLSI